MEFYVLRSSIVNTSNPIIETAGEKNRVETTIIRVEPLSRYLEQRDIPVSPAVRAGNMVYVSALPPFEPESGEICRGPIERQTEIILSQMKQCLEAAGSGMEQVVKSTIYCSKPEHYAEINRLYHRHFGLHSPARAFVCVAGWPGPFDVEIECVATVRAS